MVNSKGSIVHSELKGTLQMKAYLSGMPECKLGLNDKTMFARQVCFIWQHMDVYRQTTLYLLFVRTKASSINRLYLYVSARTFKYRQTYRLNIGSSKWAICRAEVVKQLTSRT